MRKNSLISALILTSIFLLSFSLNLVSFRVQEPAKNKKTIQSIKVSNSIADKIDNNSISVIITGDVNLARSVNAQIIKLDNPAFPFLFSSTLLKSADITMINLESPLIHDCSVTNEGMRFCGDADNVNGLLFAGIDMASIANNHSNDYGTSGLRETKNILSQNGVIPIEHRDIKFIEVKNIKFAIIGIDLIWHSISKKDFIETMQNAKEADIIISFFHWGNEYTRLANKLQKTFAQLAIDNGADLVVGSHPHWVQEMEIYKNIPIIYSYGNFIFDQLWSEETRKGIIGKYEFDKNGLIDYKLIPIYINNTFQPNILETSS